MAEQNGVFDNIKSFVFDFSDFLSSLFYIYIWALDKSYLM